MAFGSVFLAAVQLIDLRAGDVHAVTQSMKP